MQRLRDRAVSGDGFALQAAKYLADELNELVALDAEPVYDTVSLMQVRQSRKYLVWRLSHPFDERMAVRTIVWFDDIDAQVVVLLFAADKLPIGDIWYESVGRRADQIIDEWLRDHPDHTQREDTP
jgi:hypothetical protein